MTLHEFTKLNENEKASVICEATFLSYREEGHLTIVLYEVYNFYLEVYYEKEDNSILGFNPLPDLLERIVPFEYSLN